MSKIFNLLDFLRRTPTVLLKLYALRRGILNAFDWRSGQRIDPSGLAAAIKAEGPSMYQRTVTEFRKIWKLQGLEFTHGILNEVRFHNDDVALTTLLAQRSHLAKALWAVLERPELIRNAKILRDIDKLPDGAWLRYRQLPLRPGAVTTATEQTLQDALVEYFVRTQFRGANCKVDCLERDDENIFFSYSEDHPDTDLSFLDGVLTSQVIVPTFQVIFKHNNSKRTLDIYLEGSRNIGPELRDLFCRAVLGEKMEARTDERAPVFDLKRLIEPGFKFKYEADLGIADVQVSKLRLVVLGEPWRRITVEADTSEDRQALLDLVISVFGLLPNRRIFVDQACLDVCFDKLQSDRKPQSRSVWITYPNLLRLKRDELGERIIEMLANSEIERPASEDES